MPSILVFIVLPRTYLYLKLDVIPIFKSFTLSFSKHVELAYEKKNIGLFFIFVILLYLFLHFLRSFIPAFTLSFGVYHQISPIVEGNLGCLWSVCFPSLARSL